MFPFFRYYLFSSLFLFVSVFPARNSPDFTAATANLDGDDVAWRNFARFLDAGKGSEVTGMSELKRYLNRFGYLPSSDDDFTDFFDDQFVSALLLYQKRLGLPVTGNLDSDTIKSIISPRCGMSDLIKINESASALHSTRRYAFFNGQPRWIRASTLTYALSPDYTIDYLTSSEIRKILRRSFSRWSAVIPVNFTESSEYDSSDIRIGFFHGDHGDGEAFDGVLGVLAHAFSPENGRLHLDAAERWAVDFEREKSKVAVDLESVVTHEIGHVLGLAHSSVKEAVMYPSLSPRGRKVDLRIDDVEGAQALYGSNPNFKLKSFLESEKSINNSSSGVKNSNFFSLFILLFSLSSSSLYEICGLGDETRWRSFFLFLFSYFFTSVCIEGNKIHTTQRR